VIWQCHPAHGVGEVEQLEDRDLGGRKTTCYVIKIKDSGLKVMVPTEAAARVGLRPVMKKKEAQNILEILKAPEWRSICNLGIAAFAPTRKCSRAAFRRKSPRFFADMYRLKFDKDLSFGERRLLDQARKPCSFKSWRWPERSGRVYGRRDSANFLGPRRSPP